MMTPGEFGRLVDAVRAAATHRESMLHGEAHWRAVGWTALELWPGVPGADAEIGLAFALCHDAKREDDGHDPQHGPRAARMVEELAAAGVLVMEMARVAMLVRAVREHTGAGPTDDPTIGLCFDADRLNLWRVGVRPIERLLSTDAARTRIELHRSLPGQRAGWGELFERVRKVG